MDLLGNSDVHSGHQRGKDGLLRGRSRIRGGGAGTSPRRRYRSRSVERTDARGDPRERKRRADLNSAMTDYGREQGMSLFQERVLICKLDNLILEDSEIIIVYLGHNTVKFEEFIHAAKESLDVQLRLLEVLKKGFCSLKTNVFLQDVFDTIETTKLITIVVEHLKSQQDDKWFRRLRLLMDILITACKLKLNWQNMLTKLEKTLTDILISKDEFEWDDTNSTLTVTEKPDKKNISDAMEVVQVYTKFLHRPEVDLQENYSNTTIVPTQVDLRCAKDLRCMFTNGKYVNKDDYLNQLFFLMREDFLINIRKGIKQLQQQERTGERYRKLDVRVYRKVHITSMHGSRNGISYQVDISARRRQIQTLKHGQLIVISRNMFKTCFFATVVKSPSLNGFGNQMVHIAAEGVSHKIVQRLFNKPLMMLEPNAFFKTYRHTLEVLKQYEDIPLPFEKVLLNQQTTVGSNMETTTNSLDTSPSCHSSQSTDTVIQCDERDRLQKNIKSDGPNIETEHHLDKLCKESRGSPNNNELTCFGELNYLTGQTSVEELIQLDDNSKSTSTATDELAQNKPHTISKEGCTSDTHEENDPLGEDHTRNCSLEPGCNSLGNGCCEKDLDERNSVGQSPDDSSGTDSISNEIDLLGTLDALDKSQGYALQSAIKNGLCIIQGPPGCGKTYIGLRILDNLLFNGRTENSQQAPILIVCYTNHALDQCLEGVLQSNPRVNLTRLGGRSKSSKLSQYTLSIKREHRWHILKEKLRNAKRNNASQFISLQKNINTYENKLLKDAKKDTVSQLIFLQKNINTYKIKLNLLDESIINIEQLDEQITSQFRERCKVLSGPEMTLLWLDLDNDMLHFHGKPDYQIVFETGYHERDIDTFRGNNIVLNISEIYKPDKRKTVEDILNDPTSNEQFDRNANIFKIPVDERRKIYRHWLTQYRSELRRSFQQNIDALIKQYECVCARLKQINMHSNKAILSESHIIGMTTTCASEHWSLLHELQPEIVIVEEAGQVLESHILASLTTYCKKLVLIGDHKQLKPSTDVYDLQERYSIDVSLFERLVNNGVECKTLNVQRRMRPEIADNIRFIYPALVDAESVQSYPDVKGIRHNLFWISHNELEDKTDDNVNHSNTFEVKYLLTLTQYLLKQGYHPSDITVLTFYKGQMRDLRTMYKANNVNGVTIDVVDNFQGKENKIILLSLVRANAQGNIGFVSCQNRVNVSLSRAKIGLYIIGNADLIIKRDNVWRNIYENMVKKKQVGEHLMLVCQNHPDEQILAAVPDDFKKSPCGGCSKQCPHIFEECGHQCSKQCHFRHDDHKNEVCNVPCERLCRNMHRFCNRKCFEQCNKICLQEIVFTPENCSHTIFIECWLQPSYTCKKNCTRKLICGHNCLKSCSDTCNPCNKSVQYTRKCGHPGQRLCHENENVDECEHVVSRTCSQCGTTENLPCYKQSTPCLIMVDYVRNCGHPGKRKCHEIGKTDICEFAISRTCMECRQTEQVPCFKNTSPCGQIVICTSKKCGHKQIKKCSDWENCNNMCERKLDCGHTCSAKCGKQPDSSTMFSYGNVVSTSCSNGHLVQCGKPCNELLKCGHICEGACYKCDKGRFHKNCEKQEQCVLACGHNVEWKCGQAIRCVHECPRKCAHSACMHLCFSECKSCDKSCPWQCPHYTCSRKCGEVCDRPPCQHSCPVRLDCGHACMGTCGDTCPKICKTCDRDVLRKALGSNLNYQLVQLPDCGDFVRVDFMDKYMSTEEGNVIWKVCPICKTPIKSNITRYTGVINHTWGKLNKIKTAARTCFTSSRVLTGVSTLVAEQIREYIRKLIPLSKEHVTDRISRMSLNSRQNICDFEREIQRMFDCEFIVQKLNAISESTLGEKTSQLLATIDLVDTPKKYCSVSRDRFKSFIDNALDGVCKSTDLTTIRFKCEERALPDAAAENDELAANAPTQQITVDVVQNIHVVKVPIGNGRPYIHCGTSSMKTINTVLNELGVKRPCIGISILKYPQLLKLPTVINTQKARDREPSRKRKSEADMPLFSTETNVKNPKRDHYSSDIIRPLANFYEPWNDYDSLYDSSRTWTDRQLESRPRITMDYLASLEDGRRRSTYRGHFQRMPQTATNGLRGTGDRAYRGRKFDRDSPYRDSRRDHTSLRRREFDRGPPDRGVRRNTRDTESNNQYSRHRQDDTSSSRHHFRKDSSYKGSQSNRTETIRHHRPPHENLDGQVSYHSQHMVTGHTSSKQSLGKRKADPVEPSPSAVVHNKRRKTSVNGSTASSVHEHERNRQLNLPDDVCTNATAETVHYQKRDVQDEDLVVVDEV